jgi:hypothetical protein
MVSIYKLKTHEAASITAGLLPPYQLQDVIMPTSTSLPSTSETDLHFVPGSTRIILTGQRPIVRMVIQEAIENLRASLLFIDAFPDSNCALKFIQDGLFTAAKRQCPAAADVLKRLQDDEEYMSAIIPLVSFVFSRQHF